MIINVRQNAVARISSIADKCEKNANNDAFVQADNDIFKALKSVFVKTITNAMNTAHIEHIFDFISDKEPTLKIISVENYGGQWYFCRVENNPYSKFFGRCFELGDKIGDQTIKVKFIPPDWKIVKSDVAAVKRNNPIYVGEGDVFEWFMELYTPDTIFLTNPAAEMIKWPINSVPSGANWIKIGAN